MEIEVDKLPLKRVDSTDEAGLERFPTEIATDLKRLDLIRRIDFSWVVQKDEVKQKKVKREKETAPWPWQGLMESLQLAHQELAVVIDLINTVEANDAVTVAGMTRPKQLPNELLSDLSVSAATKLQKLRYLGKYFKQSAKSLENEVARETRFYGSLLRLQQNWKVKRQRQATPGNEGFSFDLHDTSSSDSAVLSRPSPVSTFRIDHDSTGMLALQTLSRSRRRMHFGFSPEAHIYYKMSQKSRSTEKNDDDDDVKMEAPTAEAVDQSARRTHSVLREIHRAIFEEQIFDLINREIIESLSGINISGMRQDYLHLKISPETSIYLRLLSSEGEATDQTAGTELSIVLPGPMGFEICLRALLHERAASKVGPLSRGAGLLGYFCAAVAHRVFAKQVSSQLDRLVEGLPYLRLQTQPTWHSRASSWSVNLSIPLSTINPAASARPWICTTNILVKDEVINVCGEGIPNTIGDAEHRSAVNCYGCDLADLPRTLLQQVGTQIVSWLHREAKRVGIKSSVDFMALCLELDQGERLRLAARFDPEDELGGISWWLAADNDIAMDSNVPRPDAVNALTENLRRQKFLGCLSLESLYSLLMDLHRI